jgi:hypothetical protein
MTNGTSKNTRIGRVDSIWLKAAARKAALCLGISLLPALGAFATQRPLSDFTSRQMAWCAVPGDNGIDCAASGYGGTACEIGFNFTIPEFWTDPKNGFSAGIDALGQLDPGTFGTTLDGSVTESPLPDGSAEVKVLVHAHNVLVRAFDSNGQPLFGYLFGEVLAGAPPTLGDSFLQIKFKNTSPGAPLPDLAQLLFCPEPGQELEVFSIRAQASGPLRAAFGVPEGTPGLLEVTQTGLLRVAGIANHESRVAFDAYPAEHVIIRATGK